MSSFHPERGSKNGDGSETANSDEARPTDPGDAAQRRLLTGWDDDKNA